MAGRGRKRGRARGSDNGWEALGGYMNAKIQKLQNQFTESKADEVQQISSMFSGISIFVNGYTNPTSDELKRLMQAHGGVFHHYYNRQLVTHIIATNLPNNKIINIGEKKVVKPEWITESIAAGKLLSYQQYLLCRKQPSITSSLFLNTNQDTIAGQINDNTEANEEQLTGCNHTEKVDDDQVQSALTKVQNENVADKQLPLKDNATKSSDVHTESLPHAVKNAKAGDPKFISEFYNNSRLHHLSTWGTEFKRYVNEIRSKSTGLLVGREKLRSSSLDKQPINCELASGKQLRVIMHIDMDCFFVSVGLRNRPDLKDKPVAVTHSRGKSAILEREGVDLEYERAHWRRHKDSLPDSHQNEEDRDKHLDSHHAHGKSPGAGHKADTFHSMAEIASCSYAARKAGVKNGMFMGRAKQLCPDLVTIPYDFEGYHQVSLQLYDTVASYTLDIEAVSCDEMLIDLTSLIADVGVHPLNFAQILRDEIFEKTKCTASAGLGPNILLAKMATRVAKPNGQFYVSPEKVFTFMNDKLVKDLPGVGYSMTNKLQIMAVVTCGQLRELSLGHLQKEFGPKTGQMLHKYSLGQDDRPIKMDQERKSVSAEINYGIRFTKEEEGDKFLQELGNEVQNRLEKAGMKGKTVTLKLKVRRKGAPKETAKFMGHGVCDNIAKSATLPTETDSGKIIGKECWTILKGLKIPPEDLRGIGIQVSHLKPAVVGQSKVNRVQSITDFTTKIQKTPDHNQAVRETTNSANSTANVTIGSSDTNIDEPTSAKNRRNLYPPLPSLPKLTSPPPIRKPARPPTMKTDSNKGKEDFVLPSQIDPAVLQELPDDIRQEIEDQMQKKMTQNRAVPPPGPTSAPSTSGDVSDDNAQPGCSHWTTSDQQNDQTHPIIITDTEDNRTGVQIDRTSPETDRTGVLPLPSPSQLDPSCLAALPPDLQREIQAEYLKQKKTLQNDKPKNALQLLRSPTKNCSPKKSPQKKVRTSLQFKVPYNKSKRQAAKSKTKPSNEITELSKEISRNQENNVLTEEEKDETPVIAGEVTTVVPYQPQICGLAHPADVKKLIAEWVSSSPEPEEEDLARFADYLDQLITYKNLEQVDVLLRNLHRRIKTLECSIWTEGFNQIVHQTQNSVRNHYNSVLKLPF